MVFYNFKTKQIFQYEPQVLPKLDHLPMKVAYVSFENKHKLIVFPNPQKQELIDHLKQF